MILNKAMFRELVVDHVTKYETTYMDAILHLIDEHGLEPEDAPKLLDNAMKSQIEAEGIALNMIEGEQGNECKLIFT